MKTDERIVLSMAELLRVQGYAATGIKELGQAARVPTGSIYHHFKGGKRDVAAAALRQTGAVYLQLLPLLLDPYDDLVAGTEAAFAAAAEDLENTGWANMCPVGTVAGEIADAEPTLREVAAEVIGSWVDEGTRYFTSRGLSDADATSVTHALLSSLEGAFILARAQRSREPLLAAGRAMAAYVGSLAMSSSRPAGLRG